MPALSDHLGMFIRTDEAGDFNFARPGRLWIGVVGGVAIPDAKRPRVEEFVAEWCEKLGAEELKARELDAGELREVAEFLLSEDLRAAAIATDSNIFSAKNQTCWRKRQYEVFKEAADRSKRAKTEPEIAARVERMRTRAGNPRHVSPSDYLQYAILTPWLLSQLFSAALCEYRALPPDQDSWLFDIALDAKTGADPGKAGQTLRDSLEAIFASDERTTLRMPGEWPEDHPFKLQNSEGSPPRVTVRKLLAGGITPGASEDDAGLQLADFVAHVVLSVLRTSPTEADWEAWRVLRQVMVPTDDGWPIKAWSWPDEAGSAEDERRYARLASPSV